jgi:putative oxidoreductase
VIPALRPLYPSLAGLGDLVLRVLVGLLFVPHGYAKLFTNTEFFLKFFGGLGLNPPVFFTYFIGSLEFFGGLAVALGLLTRPLAFMLFIDMAVASIMVHLPRGWSGPGGAEYVVTLALISRRTCGRGRRRWRSRSPAAGSAR